MRADSGRRKTVFRDRGGKDFRAFQRHQHPAARKRIDKRRRVADREKILCRRQFLQTETIDRLDPDTALEPFGIVLAGDIFYERDTAARALAFLQRMKVQGANVLVGDPGRSYLPKEKMTVLAEYEVPVIRDLEDAEIKRTKVWALAD